MRVRAQADVQTLDDELHLFEEAEWDFMSIVDTRGNNYEYFNDIRDVDFDLRKPKVKEFLPYITIGLCIVTMMFIVTMKVTNFFDDSEWRELNSIQSAMGGVGVAQVTGGREATADELIGVSNALNSYVGCVQMQSDYNGLDAMCVGKSQFAKKYYECVNSMMTIYDVHDCYARGLREFGALYRVNRINNVVFKDDIYYCYVSVEYPTIYDVSEFIHSNSQMFVKKFKGGYDLNEASISKYLLEVVASSPVPCSLSEVCIQVQESDGKFLLVDDSFMLGVAEDDYNIAVNQLLKSLDGLLSS